MRRWAGPTGPPLSCRRPIFLIGAAHRDLEHRHGLIPWRPQPVVALLVGRQDHRHGLRMDRRDHRIRRRRQEAVNEMRPGDRLGLGTALAFEFGPDAREAVLIGNSLQLPHVIALPLNRRLNLVTDFENLLLGLAPSPRRASGYRKTLTNNEQIALSA